MPTTTTSARGNAVRWGAVRYADVTHPTVRALPPLAFRLWVLLHTYSATIADGVPHYGAWQVGTRRLADDLGIEGADDDRRKSVRRAVRALVDAGLLAVTPQTHQYSRADSWHLYSLTRPAYGQPYGQPVDNLGITAEGEGHPCPPDGTPTPHGGGHPRPTSHTHKQTRTEKFSKRQLTGGEAGEAAARERAELVGMIALYLSQNVPTLFAMVSQLVDDYTADVLRSSYHSPDEWRSAVAYYGPRVHAACGVTLADLRYLAEARDREVSSSCYALRDRLDSLTRADVAAALLAVSADTRAAADDLRAAVAGAAAGGGEHPSGYDG